ncbi:MAG: TRAP transporter large permease subunit [Spirochaetia bacterium]|jgi:tripartite ATP-independent transporter DctM subunit|nr:TRAP transporter large permease subunit [Spirochaetia bacterium]
MNTEKNSKTDSFLVLISTILVLLLAAVPALEILVRIFFNTGVKASYAITRYIVLWIAFTGSYLATAGNNHLSIEAGRKYLPSKFKPSVYAVSKIIVISVLTAFLTASISFIFIVFDANEKTGIINTRFLTAVIPVCLAGMIVRESKEIFNRNNTLSGKSRLLVLFISIAAGLFLSISSVTNFMYIQLENPPGFMDLLFDKSVDILTVLKLPVILIMIISGALGTPIFIVLGGITYILLSVSGGYTEIAVNEIYAVLTGNMIPAIPLFTITGFILSESSAGERMIDFFKKAFGWFPGGIIIAVVLISAFFTTFTGASGVTILALGGILFMILDKYGVDTKFRTGILTSSGSIGLLFPPSLPIILYGIIANLDIKNLFIAGILPGSLLVFSLSAAGIVYTKKHNIKSEKFELFEILKSIKNTFWELLLPLIILVSYFSGLTTIVETGAVAVVYVLIIETFVYKDLNFSKLLTVVKKSVPVIGGILIILGMSKALSFYMIDEMIPQRLSEWIAARITSRIVFLILLNIILLLTGCLMDIFSAIIVVVPLLVPLGEIYNIHPVHMGIIFLANLELGYLTPPVGLNLFLASYRFEQPLEDVYMSIIPFFIIMLIAVFIITFVPQISLIFLS